MAETSNLGSDLETLDTSQDLPPVRDWWAIPEDFHQLTADELKEYGKTEGRIFDHYQPVLTWLQPERIDPTTKKAAKHTGCLHPWQPVREGWEAQSTENLWRRWEKLLPLMADPSVEEIFVQRFPATKEFPATPSGYLDIKTSGMLGDRRHPHLRVKASLFVSGLDLIVPGGTYNKERPQGLANMGSPLEVQGTRLQAGVPPSSVAPFAAIRIPSRDLPDLTHVAGAKRFGADLDAFEHLIAEGVVVKVEENDPLGETRAILEDSLKAGRPPEGRVMIPLVGLEYIRALAYAGWNPVFSGATSSAKTTCLNACLRLWPQHWRTVTVETGAAELRLKQYDWVPLFSNDEFRPKDGPIPNELSQEAVLKAAMRLSPRPIPCGEVRAADGALWVRLSTTGHEASPVTLHAGSADECLMRLVEMVLSGPDAGKNTSEETAKFKAARAASVIIQLKRDDAVVDGKAMSLRRCDSITEVHLVGKYIEGTMKIKLVPVFETQIQANGMPELVYVGRGKSRLWDILRKNGSTRMIPKWAQDDKYEADKDWKP